MAISKNKESDENIIRGLTEFKGDYLPLDRDRLVLFVVDFLHSRDIESTFDKIVVAAFKLFPKKFSLIGFSEYPDALTVDKCVHLHNTKSKGWLAGGMQSGFIITEKGKYFLDETKKMLEGKIKITKAHAVIPRRKEVTFIGLLKKTDAYKKYIQDKKESITKSEILDALKVPSNSQELMEPHLKKYLEYANRINDFSAIEFLEFIKRKLEGGQKCQKNKE